MDRHRALRRRALLLTGAPFVIALAALLTTYATLRERLPRRLATHFGAGGGADGYTGTEAFLTTLVALLAVGAVVFAVFTYATRTSPGAQRGLATGSFAVAALIAFLGVATLPANAGADDPAAVTLPAGQIALAFAVPGAAAALGWLLAGAGAPPPPAERAPSAAAARLPLADGEAAVWTRTVRAPAVPLVSAAVVALGVVLGCTMGWDAASPTLATGAVCAVFTGVRVTVDRRGLTVSSLLLPRPRTTIPLARVEEATVREIHPLGDFGGWGYRVRPGASGWVLRSGTAVCVHLAGGKEFVVTVDDADTAAALLNTLAARERGTGAPED
ncbi:DUF1648 domain-containing protein [Streptomyces sp. URMC 123]|uniref:DUF1648 domain-containing protein n=1 Tax=Streptomyces sp. URMC 123 TaxID=3423403 RepID=UPI003F1C0DB1